MSDGSTSSQLADSDKKFMPHTFLQRGLHWPPQISGTNH